MTVTTSSAVLNALTILIGMGLLIKGSDWLIDGAAAIAKRFGISDAVIGLTLVSIGTSLPELATNVYAALQGNAGVAMGNVVGSNITNVLLVLGVAGVCAGMLTTNKTMFRRDCMIMLVCYAVFAFFCYNGDGMVARWESGLLATAFLWYIIMLFARGPKAEEGGGETSEPDYGVGAAIGLIVLGALCVPLGAKGMVDNVVWFADKLSIPQAVVSALVIALGTSLPELAVTVRGVMKGQTDIGMGNIVGSNIFNLLLVMGVTALIRPVAVGESVMQVILPAMLLSGVMMAVFMRTGWALRRWEGAVLLTGYVGFILATVL